jgi:hypothetical protein
MAEVHINEKYFQPIRHRFAMTNIRYRRGKDIDLLAGHVFTTNVKGSQFRLGMTLKNCAKQEGNGIENCEELPSRQRYADFVKIRRQSSTSIN